jgi:outer membrane immunogenic protein
MAMRIVTVLTVAAALATVAAAPVLSADYPVLRGSQIDSAPASYGSAGIDWSGFYVGGHGSYSSTNFNSANRYNDDSTSVARLVTAVRASAAGFNTASLEQAYPVPRNSASGIGFGVLAGYNWAIGDVVVGAEADYTILNKGVTRQTSEIVLAGPNRTSLTSIQDVKLQDYASLRLRAGWTTGNLMPFATAGVAVGRFDTNFTARGTRETLIGGAYLSNPGFPIDFGKAEKNTWAVGFTAGAGVDYALTENFLVRGEYLFTTFSKVNGTDTFLHTARVAGAVKF